MKGVTVVCALLFVLPFMAFATTIPDTGQTQCYDDNEEITCPSPGQPFYGQDAQYILHSQSYTKLGENGNDLPDSAESWVMVRDNVSGLIWEVKDSKDDTPNYSNPHDADNIYDWSDSLEDGTGTENFINALIAEKFGGFSDWRMPTVKELSFIINRNIYDPTIDTTYFPNTQSTGSLFRWNYYWSSTTHAYSDGLFWIAHFFDGHEDYNYKSYKNFVRAVRGGYPGSFGDYRDNGDGTVTDIGTGLMWEVKTDDGGSRDKDNIYTWGEALSYCENLTLASYEDWRLPDVNELQSLVDYSAYHPSINTIFSDTVWSHYWSSTTVAYGTGRAWLVSFNFGYVDYFNYDKSDYYYVRAVRTGGPPSLTTTTAPLVSTTTTTVGSLTTTIDNETTTTSSLSETPCPVKQIFGESAEETALLRNFRNNILSKTIKGEEIIKLYYMWSPIIVKAMENDEEFKEEVKKVIEGVLPLIKEEME